MYGGEAMNNEFVIFYGFDTNTGIRRLWEMLRNGFKCRGILVSYLWCIDRNVIELLKKIKKYDVKVMLDSSAHSILYAYAREFKGENIEMGHNVNKKAIEILRKNELDRYVEDMINFVDKNKDVFDIYVELDVQEIVGIDKVNEWRDEWEARGLEPMYVWHGENFDIVKEWLERTRYIGIGGTGTSGTTIRERIMMARQIKDLRDDVWIHWFAFTGFRSLSHLAKVGLVTSSDSTSWTGGARFGIVYLRNNNEFDMMPYKKKAFIAKFKQTMNDIEDELRGYGIDVDAIKTLSNWIEVNFYNLVISEKFVEHINEWRKQYLGQRKVKITKKRISELKEAEYNPRTITEREKEKLKRSLSEFGYIEPIVLNKRTGNVVGGNQRLKVLREMYGDDYEIEVVEVDLNEDDEKALNIALNKISGEWDYIKLMEILDELGEWKNAIKKEEIEKAIRKSKELLDDIDFRHNKWRIEFVFTNEEKYQFVKKRLREVVERYGSVGDAVYELVRKVVGNENSKEKNK